MHLKYPSVGTHTQIQGQCADHSQPHPEPWLQADGPGPNTGCTRNSMGLLWLGTYMVECTWSKLGTLLWARDRPCQSVQEYFSCANGFVYQQRVLDSLLRKMFDMKTYKRSKSLKISLFQNFDNQFSTIYTYPAHTIHNIHLDFVFV